MFSRDFFQLQGKTNNSASRIYNDFQGILEILENNKLDLKSNLEAFIVSNIMFINVLQ